MASNTKYAPTHYDQYSSKDLNANFKGTKFTANAGQTTNNDLLISDDMLIDGGMLVALNSTLGDKVNLQVIDKDNILGYGANTVLGQYMTDWYMNPDASTQINFQNTYPAKLYAGLYLRVVYISVGQTDIDVIVNYRLHKVLW